MSNFGTTNRVALRQVPEVVWGETPAAPSLAAIRFTSESLNYNAEFIVSEEIRADRMTPDTIQVSSDGSGDINGEWSFSTYDEFIAGAMLEDWSADQAPVTSNAFSITKVDGNPSTWKLLDGDSVLPDNAFTRGSFIRVTGFPDTEPFYAEVLGQDAAGLGIKPLINIDTTAAGSDVTVQGMSYVRNGVTDKSFTIQKAFTDLSTPEYWNFTGARVSTWSLELATSSILTTTFGIMAKDGQMSQAQIAGATVEKANTNTVLNAVDNVAAIVFDGDPSSKPFYFNSLSINVDNAMRTQEAVGLLGLIGVEAGRLSVTGSIELYFENGTLFNKYRTANSFSLTFAAQDREGNAYIVTIPRAKYTQMEIVAGGRDADIFASAEFEGIINLEGTYQIQISRIAA